MPTELELRNMMPNKLKAYIGCKEGGAQHMDIVNTYNAIKPLPMGYRLKSTDAWCAATVSAMAAKCGFLDIVPAECSCVRQIALWQKMGRWVENDAYVPKVGDIIYYDWDDSGKGDNTGASDHVGIVCAVNGNNLRIIEGNKADTVGYRDIQVNGKFIRGYGIPDYAKKATKPVQEEVDPMAKFKDTKNSAFEPQIDRVSDLGWLKGYVDGSFKPDQAVTRGQLAAILDRVAESLGLYKK